MPLPTHHPTWDILDSSKIKMFQTCPRQFFYRYIVGWCEDAPQIHLDFGEAWHRALAHLYSTDFSSEQVYVAWRDHFQPYFCERFPIEVQDIYYPKTSGNALTALAAYAATYPKDRDRYRVLEVEVSGTVPISESRVMHFRMDSILEDESGKVFSLEHKTASSLYNWDEQWSLAVQPGTYNHCLLCMYGFDEEKVRGIIMNATVFPRKKRDWAPDFHRVPAYRNTRQMNQWLWQVNDCFDAVESEMTRMEKCKEGDPIMSCFPMNPESCIKYGRVCEFHDYCVAWSNPLREIGQVPIGMKKKFWDPREAEVKKKVTL